MLVNLIDKCCGQDKYLLDARGKQILQGVVQKGTTA